MLYSKENDRLYFTLLNIGTWKLSLEKLLSHQIREKEREKEKDALFLLYL